ncbi:MAG: hypothetical protein HXX20_01195 [Chloroflexi bacterium]|nr:hypothetical protein [Chloroflexota bacterium]
MKFITSRNQISVVAFLLLSLVLTPFNVTFAADSSQYFPETGHTVSGKFLDYWRTRGGLETYGYPITDAQSEVDPETGKTFLTQWFERNRFELHPENAGTKYEVLMGLLGKDLNRNKLTTAPNFVSAGKKNSADNNYFNETGHNLAGRFKEYWYANGGIERFGYPISEEYKDVDPETGKTFVMQWFERARFEAHPENQRPYDVLLGLLGKQIKGGNQTPTPPAFTGKIDFASKFLVSSNLIDDIVIDSQDNLYLADSGNAKILKYSGSGQLLSSWDVPAPKYSSSTGGGFTLKTDGSGNLYVLASKSKTVLKYNSSGSLLSKFDLSAVGEDSFGLGESLIGVDAQGNVYSTLNAIVHKYNNAGNLLASWTIHDENGLELSGGSISNLVIGNGGNIYLLKSYIGSAAMSEPYLQEYDSQGRYIKSVRSEGFTLGLASDKWGDLYFLFGGSSACRFWGGATKYNPALDKITTWGSYAGTCDDRSQDKVDGKLVAYATGIAVDSQGNIFTVDHPNLYSDSPALNRIQKFVQH